MATLTLAKTWLNLMTTGTAVTGYRDDEDDDTRAVQGRVATYSGGRQRAVTQEGVGGTWELTLRLVTHADTVTLRSWLGQTILVRDNRGRKEWGVILEVPRTAWKDNLDLYDVALTLLIVTVDEAV